MSDKDRFESALTLTAELHRDHIRKGSGIPYLTHLMGVASIAMEASIYCSVGSTIDIGIGALLHDAIEDQGDKISLDEIEALFGRLPAEIVRECTDTDMNPKPPWRARKEKYIADIAAKARASQLVSAADKLHNSRAIVLDHYQIGPLVFERFSVPSCEVIWYYEALYSAFENAWVDNPLLPELRLSVARLSGLTGS